METSSGNQGSIPSITVTCLQTSFKQGSEAALRKKRKVSKIASDVPRNERSWLYRSSSHVVSFIERACGLLGLAVATSPWWAIFISLFLAGLSGGGLYYLKFEFRPYKLWVKEPSEFTQVHNWKMENFPNNIRKHIAIWEMDNILTAKAISQMWTLHQAVDQFQTADGKARYSDVCLKVPSLVSTKEPVAAESHDTESYDYLEDLELPSWLAGIDKNKNSKQSSDLETSASNVELDYEDYSESDGEKPIVPPLPNWLSSLSNDSAIKDKSNSHYISPETDSASERLEHCKFVEELDFICYEESLLEIWGYNDKLIKSLTDERIIEDINESRSSRVTGFPRNMSAYLGGIKWDENGRIIGAQGALHAWYTKVDMAEIKECERTGACKIEIDLGSGEEVDVKSMEWEIHLSQVVDVLKAEGMSVNLQASYKFGSVHRSALFKDIVWVFAGWGVLMVYVIITLGKPCTNNGFVIPVIVGILCVGLSVLSSYGICTLFGIPYGPLNTVLPVLLIALGVDDMYVIVNAWDNTGNSIESMDIKSRTKNTLHQAGLAITVTSVTDVIAFVVGATTEVPALRYFCVYAAVGITVVYVLQITIFVASIVLSQRFRERNEKKSSLPTLACSQKICDPQYESLLCRALGKWVKFLLKPPVTAFVLLITGFLMGAALCQVLKLQQKFESVWLLPESSDLYRWFKTMDKIFPESGRDGFVFFENISIPEELPELQKLSLDLKLVPSISSVDAWFDKLMEFISREEAFKDKPLTKELFNDALSYFLFNEEGAKYRNDIIFSNESELSCNNLAPPFTTFKINFQYIRLEHTNIAERQTAMKDVRDIVSNANLSGYKAPWALSYGQWETEVLISIELVRNVVVVLVIVFVITMVLLASFRAAMLVLVSVLATLLDVGALMHLWGLTINTVSCIALILAIGICVDYSAHITHGFLVSQGSRKYRAEAALKHMGSAVFHGGMSTLLAFLLLAPSDTFVFLSYFKILTGVAVFGLYHALVLLPILLALLGPPPYPESKASQATAEDSQSCITESTSYPCTPNSVTPAFTPQSTTPNSPTSSRASPPLHHEANTFTSSNSQPSPVNVLKKETYLSPHLLEEQSPAALGPQALKNMTLSKETDHKVNMLVIPEGLHKEVSKTKESSTIVQNPNIKKENVLKLYIKNS